MSLPAVDVALCTHNGAAFIADQLRSILSQTVLPAQIVLSDDASHDGTVAVASRVIQEYHQRESAPRVAFRVLHNASPLGVVANFQQAILATTAPLVALSDQDDIWMADRISVAIDRLQARPDVDLVHSNASLVDADGAMMGSSLFDALGITPASIESIHRGDALDLLLRRNLVTGATVVFRRTLVERAFPIPPGWVHDEWLAMVAAATGGIDVIDEPLIAYRQHGGNQIGVSRLSIAGKLRRMVEPGGARNQRLVLRAESLAAWATSSGRVEKGFAHTAGQKLAHERVRAALGERRLARVAPVISELRTGRYSRFGRGLADGARDLLQPLKSGQ
jgi:hypothetical protein